MRMIPSFRGMVSVGVAGCLVASCGSDDGATVADPTTDEVTSVGLPQIVVTTDILGDIVTEIVGDLAAVEVIMPSGASPHDFQPSARQATTMENADLLITNGAGFEAGMSSVVDQLTESGAAVFAFADAVELRTLDEFDHHHGDDDHGDEDHGDEDHGDDEHDEDHAEAGDDDHADEDHNDEAHDDHADEDHADEGHDDDHGGDEAGHADDKDEADHAEHDEAHAEAGDDGHDHEAGADDPHLWTDPQRISAAVTALQPVLAALDGVDSTKLDEQVGRYLSEVDMLAADMDEMLSVIPEDRRVLITNHEVFGYFAERFDFRVAGAIIPALTTDAQASAAGVNELVELIEAEGIPAIFVESTQSTQLADAIADESSVEVAVVQLFSESLGGPDSGADTYLSMMRTNAQIISDALGS